MIVPEPKDLPPMPMQWAKRRGRRNQGSMEAKDIISAIEKTYRDFTNAPCGESWLEMDGKTLQSDIGYASEGVEFFHKCLMERLGEEVEG